MFTTRINRIERHAVLFIAIASTTTLLLLGGCSSEQATPDPTGKVAGTVTLNGKPVKGGNLMLMSFSGGGTGQGTLDSSGKFELTDPLPPGEYTVFFINARVPDKYLSDTSSDYTVTLNEGANDLKIDLK